MGELIGGLVEGLINGVKGAINRENLAQSFEEQAKKIRRGELVSDDALDKANKTLQVMRSVRARYKEDE